MCFREVVLGDHTLGEDPERFGGSQFFKISRKIKKIVKHENYTSETMENDIALIRMEEPVPIYDGKSFQAGDWCFSDGLKQCRGKKPEIGT